MSRILPFTCGTIIAPLRLQTPGYTRCTHPYRYTQIYTGTYHAGINQGCEYLNGSTRMRAGNYAPNPVGGLSRSIDLLTGKSADSLVEINSAPIHAIERISCLQGSHCIAAHMARHKASWKQTCQDVCPASRVNSSLTSSALEAGCFGWSRRGAAFISIFTPQS